MGKALSGALSPNSALLVFDTLARMDRVFEVRSM